MKILFGSIITDGAGKIGGHQVRRNVGTRILQNKNQPRRKSVLLLNNRLPIFQRVFQQWLQLTESERIQWSAVAPDYPVPDTFGKLKALTGRQLFTKLSIQTMIFAESFSNVHVIDSLLPRTILTSAPIDITDEKINCTFADSSALDYIVFVGAVIKNEAINVNPEKLPIFYSTTINDFQASDCYSAFVENGNFVTTGTWVAIAMYVLNESGFVGVRQYFKVQAT